MIKISKRSDRLYSDVNESQNSVLKRIFLLHLLLFLSILMQEAVLLVLSRIDFFKSGKVASSFKSQFEVILPIILPYLLAFVSFLIILYVFFAWSNFQIFSFLKRRINKKKSFNRITLLDISIFLVVNSLFVFWVVIFNSLLYPSSVHAFGEFVNYTPRFANIFFGIFFFLYFSFLLFSLYKLNKIRQFFFLSFLFLVLISYNFYCSFRSEYLPINSDKNRGLNVIVIGVDSLRYDFLKSEYVPHISKFFENSISFPYAFTPLARTYPSWMSFFTGRFPVHSGVRYNLIERKFLSHDILTLPSYLQKYGYYTVHAIDESRFCNIKREDGFDELIHPVTGVPDFILGKFHDFILFNLFLNNDIGRLLFPVINRNRAVAHLYNGDSFIKDLKLSLHGLANKERFFLAVHFCMPHWPFVSAGIGKGEFGKNFIPEKQRYELMLRKADHQFEQLIQALNTSGLMDKSLIIVLSDHGESFYPYWGHGTDLRDPAQNRIVLAIKPPGHTVGQRKDLIVSMVDLYPTILSFLGLPYPEGYHLDGIDILDDSNIQRSSPIFLETGFHLFHANGTSFTLVEMVRKGLEYYQVDPKSGLITVKPKYHDSIIHSKQFGVLQNDLLLVYHAENRKTPFQLIHWQDGVALDVFKNISGFHSLKIELEAYLGHQIDPFISYACHPYMQENMAQVKMEQGRPCPE